MIGILLCLAPVSPRKAARMIGILVSWPCFLRARDAWHLDSSGRGVRVAGIQDCSRAFTGHAVLSAEQCFLPTYILLGELSVAGHECSRAFMDACHRGFCLAGPALRLEKRLSDEKPPR